MANLTQAWTTASAALPLAWRIHSLRLDLVDLDGTEHWIAAAVEYEKSEIQLMPIDHRGDEHFERGYGNTPIQALLDLASRLQPLRGNPNG